MDNNVYYTGKHSSYIPVNYSIPYDSYTDYQASSQVQPQQHQQQLPHQVQTTHQQHHDIQSTISVKLDTINKSPSQKNDEIQACSGGYTGNNSVTPGNDFHGNLYHYSKNLDNSDGIAAYNQTSAVNNYSEFEHIGGSSIGQKSFSSFVSVIPQQQHQQQQQQHQPQQHQSHNPQQNQQINQQQIQQTHQTHTQHPPTAAIIPQGINVQNDITNQQTKVLGTFDQRTSSKCYNNKTAPATNSLHSYQQSTGYKESEMPYKLPPIPQTYHHVYPPYDKYSIQSRSTSHHKSYEDSPANSRSFVCQTMPMATNHKPTSQPELFCSGTATTEQHNRLSNRNFLYPNSAFTTPNNSYFPQMYHRSNNVHRNISLPPPLQPAIDDSPNYFPHNNLLVRGSSYNRGQMAFQQSHYPYARTHHPLPIPKLQSKSDIDIMSGLTEDIYHRPYNVSYDHYDDFQYSQAPPTGTHYPTKSSKVIFAPYNSNSLNAYTTGTNHQQTLNYIGSKETAQQHQQQSQPQPQQQQHHNIPPTPQQHHHHHHPSVIQNQVLSSNDYSRYSCSNVQPSNCSNKVYLQDQYSYATHAQMIYPHGTSEVAQTELPKYNQMYNTKHTTPSTDKMAMVDVEEQVTGVKILKTREITPNNSYDCSKSNYSKNSYVYNYNVMNNSYQQLGGNIDQEASKNQDIRDYLTTWNEDEEDEGETHSGIKKSNPGRRIIDAMSRSCVQNKLEMNNVPTTKIHFGIKVDNGGGPPKNLPDIIIDIEKPKVVGSDESYSSVTDKLYVLESIDVPFSDLNKYKHLSVVNKLPDNIVQIDRRKGDSLDDVEETLKLIEKCEERVRQHKSDFELDVKFESEPCASPIQADCRGDVEENVMLSDPLSIPVHADEHTVPAPSPTIEPDEENSSNDKTADDGQVNDDIDDEVDDKETMKERDSEVVRYKCVQKKVSTNGDDQIHSDDSIPKLKLIKIMRPKRSKSFRNRKIKNGSDSFDADDEMKLLRVDEEITANQVKSLKLCCVDFVNTISYRKYIISLKEIESQNVCQYSGHASIENNIECCVDKLKNNGEPINEVVEVKNVSTDLIASKQFNHSPVVCTNSDTDTCPPLNDSYVHYAEEKSPGDEPLSTFDNGDENNKENSSSYDCCRQDETVLHTESLPDFKFQTLLEGDDFADPPFDSNFESIPSITSDMPITNDTNDEISPFFSLENQQTIDLESVNVDDIQIECKNDITSSNQIATEERILGNDKCMENIMDSQSVAKIIENLEKPLSSSLSRVDDSALLESLNEFEELIGSTDKLTESDSSENTAASNSGETLVETESKDDSSSSSFSSSDDSNDTDFHTETEASETNRIRSVSNNDSYNNVPVTNTSCTSSEDDNSSVSSPGPKGNLSSPPTVSDSVCEKPNSNEVQNEPKIKIENEESAIHSNTDDHVSRSPDHEFKGSAYSSSCSDNSDESSSDSDDETVSDSVSNIERKMSEIHSPFIAREIKTEPVHPYSDTLTDESSIESCDETESETPAKDISAHDNESVKSNSSSESSDDEYVAQSPLKSEATRNGVECAKTSSDTDPSEDEDKKSCSSHHSSAVSITEKHDSLSDSVTESETCTDSTVTPVTITRKNSSTNSDDGCVHQSIDLYSETPEDVIKIEPTNEDNHGSSSDDSDEEYVRLSPLNNSPLDECPGIPNRSRQSLQLPNKNVVMNPVRSKKPTLSSDGYSSSSSSSSSSTSLSSQSSSSDEYSSDDDEVFKTKALACDAFESAPTKPIKIEEKDPISQNQQKNHKECESIIEPLETVSNVGVDALCNNETFVEIVIHSEELSITEYVENELLVNEDCNSEKTDSDVSGDILIGEVLKESNSTLSIEQKNLVSACEDNIFPCDTKSDERNDSPTDIFRESITTQNDDHEKLIEVHTPVEEANLIDPIDDTNNAIKENQIDLEHPTSSIDEKFESHETAGVSQNEKDTDSSAKIDRTDSKLLSQPNEPVESDYCQNISLVESMNVCDTKSINETSAAYINDLESASNHGCNFNDVEVDCLKQSEMIENPITETETVNSTESSHYEEEHKNESEEMATIFDKSEMEEDHNTESETVNSTESSHCEDEHKNESKEMATIFDKSEMEEDHNTESETVNSTESSHCEDEHKNESKEMATIFDKSEMEEDHNTESEIVNSTELSLYEKEDKTESEEIATIFEKSETEEEEVDIVNSIESSHCEKEFENETEEISTIFEKSEQKTIEIESVPYLVESISEKEEIPISIEIVTEIPSYSAHKDLVYPVLDIPVKLIPLPGEAFDIELYQKLIANGEIFPSRKTDEVIDFDDFYSKIPVELIPLPGETINETSRHFVEFKRKYVENQTQGKPEERTCKNHEQSETNQSSVLSEYADTTTPVIYESIPSLKVLCEKVLCVAGLHYDEENEVEASMEDDDDENISYLYIVNDNDEFWNCSTESSSPLIVCYDGELEDDVFVESDCTAPIDLPEVQENISEKLSTTSQSLSVDSFTIDSHDIQYEEIVPVNRTMYKLETFKRYLQSKYIQKPNYIQIHCIKKMLKKYLNYQRYRKNHVQATVQTCKKRIQQNFTKNLVKQSKNNNETLPLPPAPAPSIVPIVPVFVALDRFTVKDNGNVPKNDVLRSNCDINKSKLLLLTNNNIKSKKNLNSTRNHKVKSKSEVSTISSYVSEMTKNNHLKESRAFAKEIITKKRSIKATAKATSHSSPIVDKSKLISLSHDSPPNQIAKTKRKVSESVVESMETRNNKKRKLSFDDTLLGINRIYKQISMNVECDKIETRQTKSSSSVIKSKEQPSVQPNSNILNNSKDKVRRLIIPKSKIFDGPNLSAESNQFALVQIPYVKLIRDPYIDNLSKSYVKRTVKAVGRKIIRS